MTSVDEQAEGRARVPLAVERSISERLCCGETVILTARRLRLDGGMAMRLLV